MPESKEIKLARKEERKELSKKQKELNRTLKTHSEIPQWGQVVARPFVAGGAARAAGMIDGRYGTDQNQHTAALAGSIVLPVLALGLTFVSPTAGGLVADAGGGLVGAVQYMSGRKQGEDGKAKAAHPPPAG
jgi:hypothetical protein